jgi:hypothetical protein
MLIMASETLNFDSEMTQLDTRKNFSNFIFSFHFGVKGLENIFLVGNLYVDGTVDVGEKVKVGFPQYL